MERTRGVQSSQPVNPVLGLLAAGFEEDDLFYLQSICEGASWRLHVAGTLRAAVGHLKHNAIPVVLCRPKLADGDWTAILHAASRLARPPYLIVWSRHADCSLRAEVLNLGAFDLLMKPFDPTEVLCTVGMASRQVHGTRTLHARSDAGA